jgi:hypothetical protein
LIKVFANLQKRFFIARLAGQKTCKGKNRMKTMEYTFKITVQDDVIAQILFDMLKGLRGTKIEPIMPVENSLSEDYVSFVNNKIDKSEEDIANGRVYEHLEVKTMIEY